jgi:uncharacterized protein YndB with AHSA1/START domain
MSAIQIVRDYPHAPEVVWRAVTDPDLIPRWTATGAGAHPEGFALRVGNHFRFVAKPKPGWNGIVNCVVLGIEPVHRLRYSWQDDSGGDITDVTYLLQPRDGGTRFTYNHTGFTGVAGLFMSQFLGRIRRRMLTVGLPPVLDDVAASLAN